MKAMVMEDIGKPMLVKDWPEPKCPTDGAVVRVEASGICRSDWHLVAGRLGMDRFQAAIANHSRA
jgi:D-arabinose 1-dehydrogenase-like Zn-dependent alcohol dehydrogenase